MAFIDGLSPGEMLMLIAALTGAGLLAGLSGGLLGIGGGIVIVPIFVEILRLAGVEIGVAVHVAVGTSLATIIFNSVRSVAAHARRDAVEWPLLRRYGPAVFAGAALGSVAAAVISGEGLKAFFGVVCVAFAAYVALAPMRWVLTPEVPRHLLSHAVAALLGFVSALMGIGGGTFGVPLMTLYGLPIHRAVATASGFGVLIAVPSVLGFLFLPVAGAPPWTIGAVNLPAFLVVIGTTLLTTPLGVRLAHAMNPKPLKRAFAIFLTLVALNMLRKVLGW